MLRKSYWSLCGFALMLTFVLCSSPASGEKVTSSILEQIKSAGISDQSILKAFKKVPRDMFVAEKYKPIAYEDKTFSDNAGRITVKPILLSQMIENANISSRSRVLVIGSGSGYHPAVIASLGVETHVLEGFGSISSPAQKKLEGLDVDLIYFHKNIRSRIFTNKRKTFDAIFSLETGGAVPSMLVKQLKSGGRVVFVTNKAGTEFKKASKRANGKLDIETIKVSSPQLPMAPNQRRGTTGWKIKGLAN